MKRRLPRVFGIVGILVMMAASCAPAAPAPTAAPAKPAATTAPAPAAAPTTAPAAQPTAAPKPAATTAPAAPAPTTAPAAAAKPTGAPIKVGHVTALSGGSAALGQDQLRGSQLAAKEINAAGGLLGRPVEIVDRDDKFAPQEAAKQTELLILNDKADVLIGCVSAATALAMNEVAKRANAVLLATCQSNNLNKKPDFGPYTFHMALSPWMNNQAALPWITQNLGKKIFVLLADYAWGYENNDSIEKWLQVNNIQKVGAIKTPVGTADYTPLIPQIIAAKPEVLYAIQPGADSGNFLKQARPFGIFNQMKIFAPVVDAILDREPGFSIIEGQYGAMNFYWELQDKIPSTKAFVDAYAAEFKFPPSGYSAYSYAAIRAWADAVKKAGSVEAPKVTAALEGLNFDYAYGKSFVRKCDHQLFQPIHVAKGRSEAAGKAIKPWPDWAFREVLGSVEAAEKNERTCAELGF